MAKIDAFTFNQIGVCILALMIIIGALSELRAIKKYDKEKQNRISGNYQS